MTPEQLIRVVQTEHALYQWWVYHAQLGYQSIEDVNEINHEECRFGQWYDRMRESPLASLPSFQAIEKPHEEFHERMGQLKRTMEQGVKIGTYEQLETLNEKTNEIISLLKDLQKDIQS